MIWTRKSPFWNRYCLYGADSVLLLGNLHWRYNLSFWRLFVPLFLLFLSKMNNFEMKFLRRHVERRCSDMKDDVKKCRHVVVIKKNYCPRFHYYYQNGKSRLFDILKFAVKNCKLQSNNYDI